MRTRQSLLAAVAVALTTVCVADGEDPSLSAGSFTVPVADASAYAQPAPVLSERLRATFQRGSEAFERPWVVFAVSAGDWGVGPTFVADRCSACHQRGGRGAVPKSDNEQPVGMVVRVSQPGTEPHGGPRPLANYGEQLQNRALQGQRLELMFAYEPVPAEADLYIGWDEHSVTLADGEQVRLRSPRLSIENLAFGDLPTDTMTSLRIAQPVYGLGLLQAVPDSTILALAEQQKALGFNGRPNYAWDAIEQRMALGRFGWKAAQPSVRQQIVAAAFHDMGVTSSVFPRQNCPDVQTVCRREIPGNDPELSDAAWEDFELMLLARAVPARRNVSDASVQRGAALFDQLQCAACHVPTLRTADYFPRLPALSQQTFHAYTDLLLHDMGEGLADRRPDYAASGRDWRTPPLWGLGLSRTVNGSAVLLHDGRARDVVEAILWHGGEAQRSRDAFAALSKADRAALAAFVNAI